MVNNPPNDLSDASVDDGPPTVIEAGVGPDWTAPTELLEKWAQLMDALEDRTKHKIKNRNEFCYWLNIFEVYYEFEKYHEKNPKPTEVRNRYENMTCHLSNFRTDVEYLLEHVSWREGPGEPLVKALCNKRNLTIDDRTGTITKFLKDLESIEEIVHEALDRACDLLDKARHRPREFAFSKLINGLAEIYSEQIGRRTGVSKYSKNGGPFGAMVRHFLDIVEPDGPERRTLPQTISRMLNRG